MRESGPRYWGSWKGRVIKAIVEGHTRTWREIRDLTGLSEKSLNTALSEMFGLEILEKRGDSYRVVPEIYKEYKEFLTRRHPPEKNHTDKTPPKFSEDEQKALVDWIDQWRTVNKLEFSLEDKHFFLVGRHLDEISKKLIANAKTEVLAVNPFVNRCDLSNTLRDATKHGVAVNLVTRPPEARRRRPQYDISEYHKHLKEDGVDVLYNKAVHAKLIVVDRAVAISSSMNFLSTSSSGASWEAGLITVEEKVVESVVNSILELLEKPESVEMSKLAN